MTVPAKEDVLAEPIKTVGRTAGYMREHVPAEPDWLIPGFLGLGMSTELNGREKIGKGWFESYLIGQLERGDETFFGPSRQSRTLIYTEEPEQSLIEKFNAFNITNAYVIFHWELAQMRWNEATEYLVRAARDLDAALLFIDNISSATGTEDENGVELARKVEPLGRLVKEHQMALLFDRHQRKSAGAWEDVSRGGTALAGAVDQIVGIFKAPERERNLKSRGRLWHHNWERTIELNEEHTSYRDLEGTDWKEQHLFERDEWTVKEFAEVIDQSEEAARIYLKDHPKVQLRRQKRGNAQVYDVINERPPSLD